MVLPGESLAKFREKPSGAEPGGFSPNVDTHQTSETSSRGLSDSAAQEFRAPQLHKDKESSLLSSFGSFDAPVETPSVPQNRENFSPRPARPGSFSSGIEPLPGESLSKWKTHQHLPPEPATDNSPVPEAVQFASLSPLVIPGTEVDSAHIPAKFEIDETQIFSESESVSERTETDGEHEIDETHVFREPHDVARHESASERAETDSESEIQAAHEGHEHADLTEEEVTALAEHIADAQDDLAARDAQERGFAAADAAAEAGEPDMQAVDATEDEHEESELEEEEAAAEEEGMVAHPELETAGHRRPRRDRYSRGRGCRANGRRWATAFR